MAMPPNGLHAALILSRKPHAHIVSIDDSSAKSLPGFEGVFYAKDVPGDNDIGPVVADEELFASKLVTCVGQVIIFSKYNALFESYLGSFRTSICEFHR